VGEDCAVDGVDAARGGDAVHRLDHFRRSKLHHVLSRALENRGPFPGNRYRPKLHDRPVNLQEQAVSRPRLQIA
jgi:hypothetical protein